MIIAFLDKLFKLLKKASILELGGRVFQKWRSHTAAEIYVLAWLLIDLTALVLLFHFPIHIGGNKVSFLMLVALALRLLDLLQVMGNVGLLFLDQLRTGSSYRIGSATRLLVLSLVNYIEVAIIFGVIDFMVLDGFRPAFESAWDSLYYSIGIITLFGSNVEPVAWPARVLFLSELAFGLSFILVVFGRVVSLLPRTDSISRY